MSVGLEVLHCIYHFQWLLVTKKVSTKCYILVCISTLPHLPRDIRICPMLRAVLYVAS